jgi:hypothetical protein
MTPQSLHTLGSSLQAMPVAMVFSKQLLLTQQSSVTATAVPGEPAVESQTARATRLTAILKAIPGWNHEGLND